MRLHRTRLSLLAAASAAVLCSPPALSQTKPAATEGSELAEVVVTARQREEKQVDVPVTIEAFTAHDIQAAGIERPQDFMALTPGVAFVKTAEAGDLQVSIRGINTGRDTEPNFAFVVDGVLQTNPYGLSQELATVDHIEVAKGPQGAVYGRNAVAGAIIINTRKPTDQLEADVRAGYGNKHSEKATLWLSGALGTDVAGGVSAFYTKTDGFFENSYLNCNDCGDYYKEYGVAPRVIFKAGDNGSIDVKAKWSKISAGAINFNPAFALPAFAALTGNGDFWQDVNAHPFVYINNVVPQNIQENKQISVKGDWKLGVGTLTAWAAYNDQTNYFLTDGTSAAFGLYAATPWCQADITNQVGGPLPSPTFYAGANSVLPPYSPARCDGYQYQQRDQKDASVELRLASPGDQRLRWLGGVYFADIKRHVVVSQGADTGNGFLTQAFVPSAGPNPTDLLYDDDFRSKVGAVFGQLAYDLVPNLEAALALRFDNEQRTVDNNVPRVGPQTPGFGAFGAPVCPTGPASCTAFINPYYNLPLNAAATSIPSRSDTFRQLEPKISFNWKFVSNWSAFASWGVGFRSGGFNSSGSAATVQSAFANQFYVAPPYGANGLTGTVTTTPALPVAGVTYNANGQVDPAGTITYANGVSDEYKKEVSRAAEVGVKAELLDRSLFLSAAYYHTNVDDMQVFNFFAGPFGLLRVVTNIDKATLKGFEADVRWKASRYVSVFANVGTVDSNIDRYSGRPYTEGNKVPYAPSYTASAGVDFTVPLRDGLGLTARVDANSIGKTWFSPVQNNQVQSEFFGLPGDFSRTARDSYTLLNARLGLAGERWDVTAWSHNLTNKNYLAEVIPAPEFGGSFIHQGLGRAYGVDVGYRFGAH